MVRLTKIYTRTGDDGTTGLGTGARVPKADPRVEAYGTVDEANAFLGQAILACRMPAPTSDAHTNVLDRIATVLERCQHDLFDVGADLCVPMEQGEKPGQRLRVTSDQTARLEPIIDEFNEPLATLTSFVLPGGSPAAAALHVARTVVRRAERLAVALHQVQPTTTNLETVRYLNRLSDLLFVLARAANDPAAGGGGDVLWVPGANRAATAPARAPKPTRRTTNPKPSTPPAAPTKPRNQTKR